MQIVIEISEDVLKRTVFYREFRDLNDCITTIKALEKAIPLPKGHGKIGDFNIFLKGFLFDKRANNLECGWIRKLIEQATIIDADKESD